MKIFAVRLLAACLAAGTTLFAQQPAPFPTADAGPQRKLPRMDAELAATPFLPGKAAVYSEVYVKGPYIAMTFDDGPCPENTPRLLDDLKKRNLKATFFMVGQNVAEYPEIVRRIVAEGHEVANHSWSHPAFAKMSDAAVTSQIERTQDAIFQACGVKATLLRPPYGSINKRQRTWIPQTFGLQIIMWSIDPLDWRKPGDSVLRSRIVGPASGGDIILAHDIHASTVRAMPETFDQLIAKGLKFVTVSELLAMEQPRPYTTKPSVVPTPATVTPSPSLPASTPGVATDFNAPIPTPVPLPR